MIITNEIVIDKKLLHHNRYIHVLSITEDSLWYAYKLDIETLDKLDSMSPYRKNAISAIYSDPICVSGMFIKNYIYSNGKDTTYHRKKEEFEEIYNHFKNILTDTYNHSNTIIKELKFNEKIVVDISDEYDYEKLIHSMEFLIKPRYVSNLLNMDLILDYENEIVLTLEHPLTNKTFTCYLNPIWQYDEKKEYEKHKLEDHTDKYKTVCPENHVLLMISYETDEDIYLNIHTKDYLENGQFPRNSVMMIFGTCEQGLHNMPLKIDSIDCVTKDHRSSMDVELMTISSYSERKFYKLFPYSS